MTVLARRRWRLGVLALAVWGSLGLNPGQAAAQAADERAYQFAERLYRDGLYALAFEQFERFLADHPRSLRVGEALLLAADSLIRLERQTDALRLYEQIIDRHRQGPVGCEAAYRRAELVAAEGDLEAALRGYDRLRGRYPDCPKRYEAQVAAAEVLTELGRPDEALGRLVELPADPARPETLARTALARAAALEAAGDVESALAAYETLVTLFPASAWEDQGRLAGARLLAEAGWTDRALRELRDVGNHFAPARAQAARLEGEILLADGKPEAAAQAFEKAAAHAATELEGIWDQWRAARAVAATPSKALKRVEVITLPTPAVELDLEVAPARLAWAVATGARHQARPALAIIRQWAAADSLEAPLAARADSLAFEAILLEAALEERAGHPEEAVALLRAWTPSGQPATRQTRIAAALGRLELAQDRPARAASALEQAVEIYDAAGLPVPAQLAMDWGGAAEAAGDFAPALDAYRRAARAGAPEAPARLAYVEDYLVVDHAGAASALSEVALGVLRGQLSRAEATTRLADIHFEHLKDYPTAWTLYEELIAGGAPAEGNGAQLYYRAGRARMLEAGRQADKRDRSLWERGAQHYAHLVATYPEDDRADDAQFALLQETEFLPERDIRTQAQSYQRFLDAFPRSNQRPAALFALGEIYRRAGTEAADSTSIAVARDYFAQVMLDHGDSPIAEEAAYYRALSAADLGDERGARASFQECLRLYPDGRRAGDAHFALAEWSLANGELDLASEHFQWVVDQADSRQAAARLRLGDCRLAAGDPQAAGALYHQVAAGDPPNAWAAEALYKIAQLHAETGDRQAAIATYQRFARRYPDSSLAGEAAWRLGELHGAAGQHLEAAAAFERAGSVGSSPRRAEAKFHRAVALHRGGKTDDALRHLRELAKAGEETGGLPTVAARAAAEHVIILYEQGRADEATRRTREFDERHPDRAELSADIAVARGNYLLDRDPAGARAHFDALLAGDTRTGRDRFLYGRGLVALTTGAFEEAVPFFQEIVERYPDSSLGFDAYQRLGSSYYALERYDPAAAAYRRAHGVAATADAKGDAAHNWALALERAGRFDDALGVYRGLQRDYPGTERGRRAAFKVGFVYQEWGKWRQAIAAYREALAHQSGAEAAETQFWIAECYEASGDPQRAAAEYLKVGYLHPGSGMWAGTARYRAGEVYERLGRFGDAEAIYAALAADDAGGDWGKRAAEKLKMLSLDER